MAFPVVAITQGALGAVSGLFGGNPKDAERKSKTDALKAMALAGDNDALTRLRCLAGDKTQAAVALGYVGQNEPCGWATDTARAYAQAAVVEVEARRKIGDVLVNVSGGAFQAANAVDPSAVSRNVGERIETALGGISVFALVGVALVAYLLLRRR